MTVSVAGVALCVLSASGCIEDHSAERLALGEVRVILSAMPNTLDWSRSSGASAANYPLFLATMRGLTEVADDDSVVPALAERWEACAPTDTPCVYRFFLREDAIWSDGEPVVAEDFVLGWRRAASRHGLNPDGLQDISGHAAARDEGDGHSLEVEAEDPHTLRVTLRSPSSSFLARLANVYELFPIPSHAIVGMDEQAIEAYFENPTDTSPATVGSFRVASWDRTGEELLLTRNERSIFVGRLAPGERPVERLVLRTSAVAPILYRRGEVDFYSLDASEIRVLARDRADDFEQRALLSTFFLVLNPRVEELATRQARESLVRPLDRAALVEGIVPEARVAQTLVPPTIPGAMSRPPVFEVLDGSGRSSLAPRFRRPLRLLYDGSPGVVPQASIARRIRAQLGAIGVVVLLDEQGATEYARRRNAGDFDLVLRRTGADYAHPNTFLSIWRQGGSGATVWSAVSGGEPFRRFESLLTQADAEPDPRSSSGYADAERVLLEEQIIVFPLYYPDRGYRRRADVAGLEVDAFNFVRLSRTRLTRTIDR